MLARRMKDVHAVVGIATLVELTFLKGRDKVSGYDFFSLITY